MKIPFKSHPQSQPETSVSCPRNSQVSYHIRATLPRRSFPRVSPRKAAHCHQHRGACVGLPQDLGFDGFRVDFLQKKWEIYETSQFGIG